MHHRAFTVALLLGAIAAAAGAQVPPGYYDSVDTSSQAALRMTLHAVIDDHLRLPYTASSQDTWDVLENAWSEPGASGRILDVYRNRSFRKVQDRVSGYNREHLWPRSYGFPIDGSGNYPFTDCHGLALCDDGYNTTRSNRPFDDCDANCAETPTDVNNGVGGGTGRYPGNSNWSDGQFSSGRFEVWNHRRGDVARALLYMDVRYEGGVHGGTGAAEPDLILTDERFRIVADSSQNRAVAYMGVLSVLLDWHAADPVDADEMRRNDVVFQAQGNRNPFVDHPEWVDLLWGGRVLGSFTRFGIGCADSRGFTPSIGAVGEPTIGNPLTVTASLTALLQPAVLNFDVARRAIDLGPFGFTGCTVYSLGVFDAPTSTSALGSAAVVVPIPQDPTLVSQTLTAQWLILDSGGRGFTLSDGADVTIGRR